MPISRKTAALLDGIDRRLAELIDLQRDKSMIGANSRPNGGHRRCSGYDTRDRYGNSPEVYGGGLFKIGK